MKTVKRAVFFDLHGVFLDFMQGASEFHGIKLHHRSEIHTQTDLDHDDFWTRFDTHSFWYGLPILEGGRLIRAEVFPLLRDLGIPFYALTRPHPLCTGSMAGTVQAAIDCGFKFEQIVFAHDKNCCAPGFLVDDDLTNVHAWRKVDQARAFWWPSTSNNLRGQPEDTRFPSVGADLVSEILGWCTDTKPLLTSTPQS